MPRLSVIMGDDDIQSVYTAAQVEQLSASTWARRVLSREARRVLDMATIERQSDDTPVQPGAPFKLTFATPPTPHVRHSDASRLPTFGSQTPPVVHNSTSEPTPHRNHGVRSRQLP